MAYDNSDKPGSTQPDRNPDPITGAPGSHPLGTGIGSGSGALTGAAIGSIGGPVGAAIGIIAGGIVGGIMGHAAGEYNDPTEDISGRAGTKHTDPVAAATNPKTGSANTTAKRSNAVDTNSIAGNGTDTNDDLTYWRDNHKTRNYVTPDADFDADYAPAYGYGSEVSRQHALTGDTQSTSFNDLDNDLRTGWDQVRGQSKLSYDQARPAIEDAYNRCLTLHEERLNVGKQRVQTGDVTIRKEIVTEQKQVEVPVEREEVVITTRKLNDQAGGTIDDSQTLRVPISQEQINIDKQVVATGEVELNKKTIQENKTVVDNLRKEVVKVDKTGDVRVNEEVSK